jgi:hypothetical protein
LRASHLAKLDLVLALLEVDLHDARLDQESLFAGVSRLEKVFSLPQDSRDL